MIRSEQGSIFPIGIGLITLTAVFGLLMVELIGCQFQTMQAKQIADVLALQVGEDLNKDKIPPVANLDYSATLTDTLSLISNQLSLHNVEIKVTSHDGETIDATVCLAWKSITGFTLENVGKLCANSKARAI